MQILQTKMLFSVFFCVFVFFINASVSSVAPPTVSTSDDAIASFIKDKYRHLKASCYRESRQDFCRVIYTIPAKSCEKNKRILRCQFTFDRINPGQIHLVVPAGVSFNDHPLELRFQDRHLSIYAVNEPVVETNQTVNSTAFVAQFSIDNSAKPSYTNSPFVFFFGNGIKLSQLDLQSSDMIVNGQSLRRNIQMKDFEQPTCRRSSLEIPVLWLMTEEQRKHSLFVYPETVDIGTCSHTATALGFDTCRLKSKRWTRSYDHFRISLRHVFESNPANDHVAHKHKLLGEPKCVAAETADFDYIASETRIEGDLSLHRVITISKFIVKNCACL